MSQRAVLANLAGRSVLVGVEYDETTGQVLTIAANNASPSSLTVTCGPVTRTIPTTVGWVTRDVSARGWNIDTMPPFTVNWPG